MTCMIRLKMGLINPILQSCIILLQPATLQTAPSRLCASCCPFRGQHYAQSNLWPHSEPLEIPKAQMICRSKSDCTLRRLTGAFVKPFRVLERLAMACHSLKLHLGASRVPESPLSSFLALQCFPSKYLYTVLHIQCMYPCFWRIHV